MGVGFFVGNGFLIVPGLCEGSAEGVAEGVIEETGVATALVSTRGAGTVSDTTGGAEIATTGGGGGESGFWSFPRIVHPPMPRPQATRTAKIASPPLPSFFLLAGGGSLFSGIAGSDLPVSAP